MQRPRHGVMDALDPEPLLRFLHEQGVAHILIGGVAVAGHGCRRPSRDLDIVPAAESANLARPGVTEQEGGTPIPPPANAGSLLGNVAWRRQDARVHALPRLRSCGPATTA